jgi:hypothetical protein
LLEKICVDTMHGVVEIAFVALHGRCTPLCLVGRGEADGGDASPEVHVPQVEGGRLLECRHGIGQW